MNESLFSSKKMDWCTPISLFNDLNKEFHFKLDAAADDHNHKCELYYTQQQNGLTSSWNCGGTVFCNPPYGSEIKNWVKKHTQNIWKTELNLFCCSL